MIDKIQYPTVGRIVHYHSPEYVAPFAGIVTMALENRYTIPVLTVFLHDGACVLANVKHKDCVKLAPGEPYWDWMDYQKGQAAKTEALRAELNKYKKQPLDGKPKQNAPRLKSTDEYNQSVDEAFKNQASTPSPEDGKR